MSKKSGFAVTLKAFFPAEATDGDAMVKALNKISDMLIQVAEIGIVEDVQQRYMLSREVPDAAPAAETLPEVPAEPERAPEHRTTMPPIPATMRRT